MNRIQFSEMMTRACEPVERKLPRDTIFVVVAWNPETHEMHTWTTCEQDPGGIAELLEEGAKCLRHPEEIRGGN